MGIPARIPLTDRTATGVAVTKDDQNSNDCAALSTYQNPTPLMSPDDAPATNTAAGLHHSDIGDHIECRRPPDQLNLPTADESYVTHLPTLSPNESRSPAISSETSETPYGGPGSENDDQADLQSTVDTIDTAADRARSFSLYDDAREAEMRMVMKYLADMEEGGLDEWESTRTQGLPAARRRSGGANQPLDDVPLRSRPTMVPLSYVLRKVRFAWAVNRVCDAAGSDDSPFPDCRFVLRSETTITYGVSRLDHGSLHALRTIHERAFFSRLLPLHPSD